MTFARGLGAAPPCLPVLRVLTSLLCVSLLQVMVKVTRSSVRSSSGTLHDAGFSWWTALQTMHSEQAWWGPRNQASGPGFWLQPLHLSCTCMFHITLGINASTLITTTPTTNVVHKRLCLPTKSWQSNTKAEPEPAGSKMLRDRGKTHKQH